MASTHAAKGRTKIKIKIKIEQGLVTRPDGLLRWLASSPLPGYEKQISPESDRSWQRETSWSRSASAESSDHWFSVQG